MQQHITCYFKQNCDEQQCMHISGERRSQIKALLKIRETNFCDKTSSSSIDGIIFFSETAPLSSFEAKPDW